MASCDAKGPPDAVSLDELRRALPTGTWRRCLQDYRARFTADLALSWAAQGSEEEDSGSSCSAGVCQVVVSQRARVDGWHGSDPMTTGSTVWDSALMLALFMQDFPSKLAGLRVVELGSGTGLAGLLARRFGAAEVVLTDLPSMQELLQENVLRNFPGDEQRVSARPLVWQDVGTTAWLKDGHTFDLVLMSDVLYHESAVQPLLTALAGLAAAKTSEGRLRGLWAQELHRPEHVEPARAALRSAGWGLEPLRAARDGLGPDLLLCELLAPERRSAPGAV